MGMTAQEKAALAIETRKLIVKGLHDDHEYQATLASDAARKAETNRKVRHAAVMRDFKEGNALDRAVETFKVRRAVADLAKSAGLNPNGTAIKVAPVAVDDSTDVEGESASA